MNHYLAANSLFVSEILKELQPFKYDDPEQNVYSLIKHIIQFEKLLTAYMSILLISKHKVMLNFVSGVKY